MYDVTEVLAETDASENWVRKHIPILGEAMGKHRWVGETKEWEEEGMRAREEGRRSAIGGVLLSLVTLPCVTNQRIRVVWSGDKPQPYPAPFV